MSIATLLHYYIVKLPKTFIVFLLFAICYLLFAIGKAHGFSVGVAPTTIETQITAPFVISKTFVLENNDTDPIDLDIVKKPFASRNALGEVDYTVAPKDKKSYEAFFQKVYVLDNGIPIESILLSPKQTKRLTLQIDIPKDENPSDYYFSLLFISKKPPFETREESAVTAKTNILGAVALHAVISVNPKEAASGILEEFSTSLFHQNGPIPFRVTIKNTSNHYIKPQGYILIQNIFGQIVGKVDLASLTILKDTSRILPSSTHNSKLTTQNKVEAVWSEKFVLGPYKASIFLTLSPTGPLIQRSLYFIAIPLWMILSFLIPIVIVLIIYKRVKRNLKA